MLDPTIGIMIAASIYFAEIPITKESNMISANQLREMITEILSTAPREALKSKTAVELLMLTAATESHLGTYYRQIKGPALGIFQMEPATERDIFDNFLTYPRNHDLLEWVVSFSFPEDESYNLKYNLAYQIAMARVHYWRVRAPLPNNNAADLANYWKDYFNTSLGKGSPAVAIYDYQTRAFNNL